MKGVKGIGDCDAFAKYFLTGAAFPVTITVDQFDRFAQTHGVYTVNHEPTTVQSLRNRFKNKINNTATSEAWKIKGREPFHIQVKKFGVSYTVHAADDAFTRRAERIPVEIQRLMKTKHKLVKAIRSCVDYEHMPLRDQLRIDTLDEELDSYEALLVHATKQVMIKVEKVTQHIQKLVDRHELQLTSNGDNPVQKLLDLQIEVEGPEIDEDDLDEPNDEDFDDTDRDTGR